MPALEIIFDNCYALYQIADLIQLDAPSLGLAPIIVAMSDMRVGDGRQHAYAAAPRWTLITSGLVLLASGLPPSPAMTSRLYISHDSRSGSRSRRGEHLDKRLDRARHLLFGDVPGGAVIGGIVIAGIRACPSEDLE